MGLYNLSNDLSQQLSGNFQIYEKAFYLFSNQSHWTLDSLILLLTKLCSLPSFSIKFMVTNVSLQS